MSKRLRMSGQRWVGVMRDVDPNGGTGGGGGQPQQQQGGQGQGQQQQGQQQGGPGAGGSGVGDDFWTQGGGQGQGQAGQQPASDPGAGQGPGQPLTMDALNLALTQLQQTFTSEIDRRVNQIVRGRGGQGQGQGHGQQPPAGQGNGGGQQPAAPVADVQATLDAREARMAFRDYVGSGLPFIDAEERALAHALGAEMLASTPVGDPDLTGRQVAAEVQSRIRATREMYRKATISALKRTGNYVEKPAGGQHGSGQGSAPASFMPSFANPGASGNKFQAAAEAAAAFNQANGHKAAPTGQK